MSSNESRSWADWAMAQVITDPRKSPHCWSAAEVGTPDGFIRELACERRRHRWGRHTNRHVRWKCPKRCVCVRHANRTPAVAQPSAQEGTGT